MTKHYAHEEIRAIIDLAAESPLKLDLPDYKAELYKEAPAIIRQLLEENERLKAYEDWYDSIVTLPIVTCPECGNHQFETGGPMLCAGCEKHFLSDEWMAKL